MAGIIGGVVLLLLVISLLLFRLEAESYTPPLPPINPIVIPFNAQPMHLPIPSTCGKVHIEATLIPTRKGLTQVNLALDVNLTIELPLCH